MNAVRRLGWDEIDAIVVDMSDVDRRRWEIAENLHRADLTELERSEHVNEWIRLTEERATLKSCQVDTKSKSTANPKGAGRKKAGVNQAARDLNLPGKTEEAKRLNAHRAVKIAGLSDEAKAAAVEVGLDDNQSALLAAAKAEPQKQAEVLREYATKKRGRP